MRERLRTIEHRLLAAIGGLALVIAIGTGGYFLLEPEWSLLDAVYMSVITVTTVGFKEARPLDDTGRIFTLMLVLFGVGAFTYAATSVANYLIAGDLGGLLERRRMQDRVKKLSGHFIICGYGRMGEQVASELDREKNPLVVIESDQAAIEQATDADRAVVEGDACDDDVLRRAGVERARALIAVLDSDATNLMVTLSARAINPDLFIVARANTQLTQKKLTAAGADRVLWPYGLGGRRIAQMALRPNVVEFLEVVMHDEELELQLEEMKIAIESRLDGTAIGASAVREKTGANVVAIRRRTGKMLVAPTAETPLEAGDILVALGTREQLNQLRELSAT